MKVKMLACSKRRVFFLSVCLLGLALGTVYLFAFLPWPSRSVAVHTGDCLLGRPAAETPGRFYLVLPCSGQVCSLDIYSPDLPPGRHYSYSMFHTAGGAETGDRVDCVVDYNAGSARWHFSPAAPANAGPSPRFCPACAAAMAALLPKSAPRTALLFDAASRELLALRPGPGLARGDYQFSYAARPRVLTILYAPA